MSCRPLSKEDPRLEKISSSMPEPEVILVAGEPFEMCHLTRKDTDTAIKALAALTKTTIERISSLANEKGEDGKSEKNFIDIISSAISDLGVIDTLVDDIILKDIDDDLKKEMTVPEIVRAAEAFYNVNFLNLPDSTRIFLISIVQKFGSFLISSDEDLEG